MILSPPNYNSENRCKDYLSMEGLDCGKGHGKWTKELWNV